MQHYSDTNDRKDTIFTHSISEMRRAHNQFERRINSRLADATRTLGQMVFGGTVVRVELYHLCQPEMGSDVFWHRHPFTELTWVKGGAMTYEYGSGSVTVKEGECFLMPALIPHRWHAPDVHTVLHGFMLTILPAADPQHSLAPDVRGAAAALGYRLPQDPKSTAALREAEKAALHGDVYGIQAAAGFLRAGLARLFRRIMTAVPVDGESDDMDEPASVPVALEQAVAFITAHLADPLDVPCIARRVELSPRQLDRLFHAAFDMPTGAFLLHTRLERARYLLGDSDLSIKQVAYRCGFSDPNYFTRIFRQRHGQTPGAYRQQV